MLKVKITQVGNSMGVLLPKEALAKMKTGKGDTPYLVEGSDGYALTPYSRDFEEQMTAAEAALKLVKGDSHVNKNQQVDCHNGYKGNNFASVRAG
jgi:putative addiction module antidote